MIEALRQAAVLADPAAFWIACLGATVGAGFALRQGLKGFWRLRLVTDTPTAKVRSAPQGYVELIGRALPHRESIQAALTHLPCLWFRFKIEEQRGSGKNKHWVTVESGEADRPFLLDDGTGRCLVEPSGAELHCRAKDTWYGSHRRAPKRQGHGWLSLGGRFRLTEERIHDQDPIYLLGHFETPRRGPEDKERLTRSLLSTWKRDPKRMAGFDKNGDGEISLDEWEDARAKAANLAERSESRLQAEPPLSRAGNTSDSRRPFLIATLEADSLLWRLRLHTLGGTALFLLLAAGLGLALTARLLHG